MYFVTICTKDRIPYFGEIQSGDETSLKMTAIGEISSKNWLTIPQFHPYVELDEFIIMPDHLHAILFINKPDKCSWETNKFGPQRNNLASIIRGYKSSVKTYATTNDLAFDWQPRYYDRVIRNELEHQNIRSYIYNNPDHWLANEDYENLIMGK